ncbi:MAG TPA: metallophosphoesterase [Thermoanaerobaculia bacterium]|nr:metallophosphoesterase [Thermoanaerobaculia bacterium]
MIAQVLNRQFVLDQLEEVRQILQDAAAPERRGATGIEPAAAAAALAELDAVRVKEAAASSGQPGFEPPPPERRGEEAAPLDDFSFFSRDAVLSNLQSALEQVMREKEELVSAELPDDRRSFDADVAVTDVSLKDVPAPTRDLDGRRIFDKFSVTDIRWVSALLSEGVRKLRGRYPFPDEPAAPVRIGDRARLLVVGDWGSGLPRAQKVAQEMRKVLDEGIANRREQHVLHLGDVYYSGWEYEYRDRFLSYWPVRLGEEETITSWNLNGNHDMYSGGHAFYGYALQDPRFKRQQGKSHFSLQNDHWTLLGLDTAWEDGGLAGHQAQWAAATLTGASGKGMLLSHHQIFSAYESGNPVLSEKIAPVLATGRVKSWIWGHEHRCVFYGPHQGVDVARCLGHGGVPVYMTHTIDDPYPAPSFYEYRNFIDKGLEHWALFGFAVLDFDGPVIHVRYLDENGKEHQSEQIG